MLIILFNFYLLYTSSTIMFSVCWLVFLFSISLFFFFICNIIKQSIFHLKNEKITSCSKKNFDLNGKTCSIYFNMITELKWILQVLFFYLISYNIHLYVTCRKEIVYKSETPYTIKGTLGGTLFFSL